MEQPHANSTKAQGNTTSSAASNKQQSGVERKGPRLNRYYENLPPYYKLKQPTDNTLVFESRFESGNLRRVVKVADYEYDLFLKNDYGTNGNT